MADEGSLAQNRTRRVRKEKKFDDESPPQSKKTPQKSKEETKKPSTTPSSGNKRKQIEENGRGAKTRTKTANKNETEVAEPETKPTVDQGLDSQPADELSEKVTKFIATLSAKKEPINMISMEGKKCNLKITTWNVNGLRNLLIKQNGLKFIKEDAADILCFQETKCGNSKVPMEVRYPADHKKAYFNGSEDGHSGVACLVKQEPVNVTNGIGKEIYDKEARVITMEYEKFYLVNVYVPNSGRGLVRLDFRMKWDADFLAYLKDLDSKKPIIVCGDLNVSHHEIDLTNPKTNLKTAGFTIGERDNFTKLLNENQLVDIFRLLNPGKPQCYTYWSYMQNSRAKNIGWRLDYFLLSRRWAEKTCDVVIQNKIEGSDHCPVSIYMAI